MADPAPPLLEVRDLRTYFFQDEGVTRALDGVSFSLRAGQTLGIVGESGGGKSVTAQTVLGLIDRPGRVMGGQALFYRGPAEREAMVDLLRLPPDGREMRAIRGGEIGYVFQEPMSSFSPVHTIGNQIVEAVRTHRRMGRRQARETAIALLRQAGVSRAAERLDEYPRQLSGGLRQRAMIALALGGDPGLLIADEPTTALDVTTQAQILELLRRLRAERGMSVLLITHNFGVIAELADEVAVMYLGRIVECGPVRRIFRAPRHPYTQALLRSRPSVHAAERERLMTVSGAVPHPYARPEGCPFHPRCGAAIAGTCDRVPPAPRKLADGGEVSCHLPEGA